MARFEPGDGVRQVPDEGWWVVWCEGGLARLSGSGGFEKQLVGTSEKHINTVFD